MGGLPNRRTLGCGILVGAYLNTIAAMSWWYSVLVVQQRRLDHINDDLIIGAVPGAASASWADQRSASDECSARDVDDLMTCGSAATWERGVVAGLCAWSVRGPDDGRPPECFCLTRESLLS